MAAVKEVLEVEDISRQIYELMAGRTPAIQGAICADLLSCWLAGHIVPGDQKATDTVREKILQTHLITVRRLIPINEELILAKHRQ